MPRKKRLLKGIGSLEERRREHLEKLRAAETRGNLELVDYYRREIQKFEREIAKKKRRVGIDSSHGHILMLIAVLTRVYRDVLI